MAPGIQGRKIAIIGASGQLGKPTIDALVDLGAHTITAIQRSEAASTFPAGITVKKGNLKDEAFLTKVLKGQDVLVLMPPLAQLAELQEPAIRAAANTGIPYILLSEFGPDPFAGQLVEENELLIAKKRIRDLIESIGLDAGLTQGLWGMDPKTRKATIWRGADTKISTATISHAAEAVAAMLSLPEAELARYKNKAVYTPSFHLTQREILDAVQRAIGTTDKDWDIETRDVNEVAREYEDKIGEGDSVAPFIKFFVTHFLEGHGGDFNHKADPTELEKLAQLGLHKEDLEQAIKVALQ